MGGLKTDRATTAKILRKARAMGEAFAENRAKQFTTDFINQSGLARNMHKIFQATGDKRTENEILVELTNDLEGNFGGFLAIAYAMGYIDCAEGKTIKTLYVPPEQANSTNEKPVDQGPPGSKSGLIIAPTGFKP